jgi:hypothetical protein
MLTVHATANINVAMSVIINNSDFDKFAVTEDNQSIAESMYLSASISTGEDFKRAKERNTGLYFLAPQD